MKKGFSLIEVIVSIAAIAIISGFVLQMFLVSQKLNQKARDLDYASNMVLNSIEVFKGSGSVEQYLEENALKDTYIKTIQDSGVIEKYFDKEWNQVTKNANDKKFCLSIDFSKQFENSNEYSKTPAKFYRLHLTVKNLNINDDKGIIANYTSSKYFS